MSGLLVAAARRGLRRGQALAELAIVFPILILLLFGSIDVGRIIFAYIALEEAVQEGASFAAAVAPSTDANRWSQVRWRVISSSDHPEVQQAAVANPSGVVCSNATGLITVTATYPMPLITPVGSTLFGGAFTLTASVTSTNIRSSCTP